MKSNTLILLIFLLSSVHAFSQKIKIKKDIAYVDDVEYVKIKKNKLPRGKPRGIKIM